MQNDMPVTSEQNYNQNPEGFDQSSSYGQGSYEKPSASPQKPKLGNNGKIVLVLIGLCVILGVLFGILMRKPSVPDEQGSQEAEPVSEYEKMNDAELLSLFYRAPNNEFRPLGGVKYELYEQGSAESDEDALQKIESLGGDGPLLLTGTNDDYYTVLRNYRNSIEDEYSVDMWVLYKSSVFDIESETFNATESYYWENAKDRLKDFLDTYVAARHIDGKLLTSEFMDNGDEYVYKYYCFVAEYDDVVIVNDVKLYEGLMTINKQTRRITRDEKMIKHVSTK